MKFAVFTVLLCLTLGYVECSGYNKKLVFPADVSIENYVILDPDFSQAQEEMSVCSWVKRFLDGDRYWFGYAISSNHEEVLLGPQATDVFMLNIRMPSSDPILRNKWSHICLTWSLASLTTDLYYNGVLVSTKSTAAGRTLGINGKLVLGQEQDSLGGGFQISQTFGGELYQLNVLKKKLSGDEVKGIYEVGYCSSIGLLKSPYTVLQWEDFLHAEIHGNVVVSEAGCGKWNILYDFIGQEITTKFVDHLNYHHFD